MSVTICTGWSPKGFLEYGQRFEAGAYMWPEGVEFRAYVEDLRPGEFRDATGHGVKSVSLWSAVGAQAFLYRHRDSLAAQGRECRPGMNWKARDRQLGYSFRYDAVKFSRQCFIPEAAARDLRDGDILVWLDGDVVTHASPPVGFVDSLVGDADGAYLGRELKHSEIGFWAVRLGGRTRDFLARLAALYRDDAIFGLKEWHSAYAWDHCRRIAERSAALRLRNLTPGGHDHVWQQSPLARYTDHLKGARKGLARSPEARR